MYTYEQKQQIYKRWKEQGELWFSKDPSKDPTWEEKQIIIEIKKQENEKLNRKLELEKRAKRLSDKEIVEQAKDVRARYGNKGFLSDKIFDALDTY
jgi:hypothetical protein